jgi:hypothetical protein
VGIFPESWIVECPFVKEDIDNDGLELFRKEIADLYSEFADGKIIVDFDFEKDEEYF